MILLLTATASMQVLLFNFAWWLNENLTSNKLLQIQPGSALKDMTNVLSSTATPTTPKSPQMTRLSQRHFMTSPGLSPYPSSPRAGRQLGIGSPTDNEVRLTYCYSFKVVWRGEI